jgi:hypothetical protein
LGASVRLTDLLVFLESAEPQYDWLRHFAARWRAFHPHLENERFSKPSYSDQEMQDWFRERVSNWGNNKPPSEASDWKEFRMRFPGVKREPFRELRRANTPPEWRKQGPR